MKTKVLILCVLCFLSINIFAATKQDIIDFAKSQDVCDSKTSAIFNSYRNTFTRLVRQKALTNTQCEQIMTYLKDSVGILNSKGICSLSDLNKLTTAERDTIYYSLTSGANIIINAPTEGFEADNNTKNENGNTDSNVVEGTSGININKTDGTIDVYENGILIDKIQNEQQKLTYTGPNKMNIVIICAAILFIISLAIFLSIYKKHTSNLRCIKNILISVEMMSALTIVFAFIIRPRVNTLDNVVEMLNLKPTENVKSLTVTQDKTIIYPSYGYVYGKLYSEDLGIEVDIAFGDSSDILSKSAGTASWSSLPTEGKNIIISAHNSTEMFAGLENVSENDVIVLDTTYAKCVYKVYDTQIVLDTDVDKVDIKSDVETLVLYTCYPFSEYIYSDKRFVVYSKLESIEWK